MIITSLRGAEEGGVAVGQMELLLVGGREECTLDGLMKAIVMKAIVMMAMMMKLPTMVNMVVIMVTGIRMKSNCRNTN